MGRVQSLYASPISEMTIRTYGHNLMIRFETTRFCSPVRKNHVERLAVPGLQTVAMGWWEWWTHWVDTGGLVFSLACRNRNLGSFRSGGEHRFDFGLERH